MSVWVEGIQTTPVVRVAPPRAFRAAGALALAGVGGPPAACRHVLAGAGGAVLCADHPELGVACVDCFTPHLWAHNRPASCEGCGSGGGVGCWAMEVPCERLRVAGPDGRPRTVPGGVRVEQMALCPRCATPLDPAEEDPEGMTGGGP